MAVSGKRFGGSVKESDFLHDFPCAPCEKDGKNVEAVKYCADCDENLCAACLTSHNKFALMRGHKVLNQVQTIQGQTKQLPSQRCSKHGGKVIDVFCPEHDVVGCSTCISVDHSSCKGKKFIPDVATGIKTSQELKQLEAEMVSLISKLDSLKKRKDDNLQRLKQDKDALKKEIQFVRKKMNEQLDKMEKQLVDEVEATFKQKIDAVHTRIAEVDDMLAKVKHAIDQVKSDNNEADVFVSCKLVKLELSNEIYPLRARIDKLPPECSFDLHTDENAKLIMEGKRIFASINEKFNIQGAAYNEDINIRLSDDEKVCKVFAMCNLPDGCLVIADYNNKKLKKLDPVSSNVSTLINLSDQPIGICRVDNTRLAVSLANKKKIHFVSLSGKVTLGNSFSVGDRCRCLAYCDGLLYVCCGGDTDRKEEGCGRVEVYSCTGELLRCLYEDFGCPQYIAVINDGYKTTIYTSDDQNGVLARGIDGSVKHRFQTGANITLPFSLVGTDHICIGEYSTGKVYIQTYMNKRILLQKNDVKGKPLCLYFDNRSSRLCVALHECVAIKLFNLKM